MSAFHDQGQFDMLMSSLARYGASAESLFLWQVARGIAVEPAASVIATMHSSAVHSGNIISLINL